MQSKAQSLAVRNSEAVDWQSVYGELLPKVFHYFAYRCGETRVAEDLASTTFERAWRKRERYKSDLGKFEAWIFGIARHVAAEYFRSRRNEIPLGSKIPTDQSSPEETTQVNSDYQRLASLLSQLPERDRDLLSLKYGAGQTNRTIAKLVRMSESNVGTVLHRLVKKLRDQWEMP